MPERTVRLLTVEDAEAYRALRLEMLEDSPWAFSSSPEDDRMRDPESTPTYLRAAGRAIVGGFKGDALVAAVGVARDEHLKQAHRAWVWGVYVAPAARRKGLGKACMALAIETARSWAGVEVLTLSVSERSKGAVAMYRSLGFESWGVERDVVRVGEARYDEIHMALRIDGSAPPVAATEPPAE